MHRFEKTTSDHAAVIGGTCWRMPSLTTEAERLQDYVLLHLAVVFAVFWV